LIAIHFYGILAHYNLKEIPFETNLEMSTQDEKVAETQQRLASLVRQTEGTTSKSLLIQTVALFECLLGMRF
jgi:hypothetical protein